nr:polyprenyl synthetase family protein [Streptomyces sp. CB01249]
MSAPLHHLTGATGRRWRPVMFCAAVDLLGGDSEQCGPLIAAFEMLHTGSLVVDGIQDESPLRRGRPSVHTVFGASKALHAGTAAYFLWDRAVQLSFPDDAERGGELRTVLLSALRAGHAGQALGLQGHRERWTAPWLTATGTPFWTSSV